jgi:cell wall-associated NlpC family hydrolase
LLRVNSAGVSDTIKIMDWSSEFIDGDIPVTLAGMITNADQGVLLSWNYMEGDGTWKSAMAVTTGTSVSLISQPPILDPSDPIVPVLQAQDGSFVGTTSDGGYMIAFDGTGNVRWTVPGLYQPQIATADGGVIAQAWDWNTGHFTGPAITFDQNGNATGQLDLPTYSWFGNSYQVGSVEQVLASLLNIADSFWAFAQGNASGNGTANRPLAKTVQQLIAQSALGYVGSQNWVGLGHPACNQFVQKVLEDAGQQVPYSTNWVRRVADFFGLLHSPLYPALAGDWASRTRVLGCWHNVTFDGPPRLGGDPLPADLSKPGDIIAEAINYSNATGHVGIVVGAQQTVSADSAAACFPPNSPTETIDISDYGFRPDSWVDPYTDPQTGQPCRSNGKKSNAVVKRFVCQ